MKGVEDFDLKEALAKAARILETRITLQAPVRSGALKRSVRVTPLDDSLMVEYVDYGDYTNYGTGRYYPGRFKYGTSPEPGSFTGYREGRGGIRPQYWTAASASDFNEIENMMAVEISRQVEEVKINKLFDDIDTKI